MVKLAEISLAIGGISAFFAYLAWRKSSMQSAYEFEDQLHGRFGDNHPDGGKEERGEYVGYKIRDVRVHEVGGKKYRLKRYLPWVSMQSLVQISLLYNIGAPPTERALENHPWYDQLPIKLAKRTDQSMTVVMKDVDLDEVEGLLMKFTLMNDHVQSGYDDYSREEIANTNHENYRKVVPCPDKAQIAGEIDPR